MFGYQIQIYENKQWQDLPDWSRPFTDGTSLDDTLDAGCINLSLSPRSERIRPFTPIRIIVSQDGKEVDRIYRLVASTKRTKRTFAQSTGNRYDWTINTIELTKLLERRFVGTMTATKYLTPQYTDGAIKAASIKSGSAFDEGYLIEKNYIMNPLAKGTSYVIPFFNWGIYNTEQNPEGLFATKFSSLHFVLNTMTVISPSGNEIIKETFYDGSTNTAKTIELSETGTYHIKYDGNIEQETTKYDFHADYSLAVFEQIQTKTQPTITTVCQRLLSSGVTRRNGISNQEFELDADFAEQYKEVGSPEFSFTNCTLWDALSQVGGFIHAIPRLVPRSKDDDTHYNVTFDKLGGSDIAPYMPPLIYQDMTLDINEYCGTIASPAQNLCNTEDDTNGAITELGNDYITVRAEEGAIEINGDNVIIRTSMPIQKLVKLECGFIPGYENGGKAVGNITAYAYEDAEYSILSSYWGSAYPYSKAWALRWKQGGNVIDGLSFKQEGKTSASTAFGKTAIVNIIEAKTGVAVSLTDATQGQWYRQLAFKVTYVPIVTARVEAIKPYDTNETNNTLVYNQGANVAETSFYGEKMRGAIARLGQAVEQRTYDIKTWNGLPKVGQLLDGKYIATIDAQYDITRIRISVTLTKDFNQLSQFVGLNSNYRLYDISEKQSVERHIHYFDKIVLGHAKNENATPMTIIKAVADMMRRTFHPFGITNTPIDKVSVARVLPFSNGTAMEDRSVVLPVAAFPFGTSLCFSFSFFDNYGAGYQSSNDYDGEKNKATQRLVPYTDVYGEISELHFGLFAEGWTPTIDTQKDGSYAMLYPQNKDYKWNGETADEPLISTSLVGFTNPGGALIINKDSREKIDVTYQVHFCADEDNIVVGAGLADFCQYVGNNVGTNTFKVYVIWLDHTINGLNKYISGGYVERINLITQSAYTSVDGIFRWNGRECPTDRAFAYAVCKMSNNGKYEMLFGENYYVEKGGKTKDVYFSPVIGELTES
nr:MAG TPA: hypothetical protein [Caudoviricetes sp.]